MKVFSVTAVVHATSERLWAILTDASEYPTWNTTVTRIEGRIASGERIKVHAKINPGRAFPVTVSQFDPPTQMTWTGGMPLGLFTGTRTFTLHSQAGGEVEFTMREVYSGALAPLIGRSIPDLQPAFEQFAADLKRAAESSH